MKLKKLMLIGEHYFKWVTQPKERWGLHLMPIFLWENLKEFYSDKRLFSPLINCLSFMTRWNGRRTEIVSRTWSRLRTHFTFPSNSQWKLPPQRKYPWILLLLSVMVKMNTTLKHNPQIMPSSCHPPHIFKGVPKGLAKWVRIVSAYLTQNLRNKVNSWNTCTTFTKEAIEPPQCQLPLTSYSVGPKLPAMI
jgi:hypothetical protein